MNSTGVYVGANAGYGGGVWTGNTMFYDSFFGEDTLTSASARAAGFVFGGQVGYNRQFGHAVLGVESDIQWSDVRTAVRVAHQGYTPFLAEGSISTDSASIDWLGTTRLRAGWASGRFMPFVTAGVAYGQISYRSAYDYAANIAFWDLFRSSASTTRVGWTIGSGGEYAVDERVSLKAEYLYTQLPGSSADSAEAYTAFTPLGVLVATGVYGHGITGALGTHMFRAGVNVRFGEP